MFKIKRWLWLANDVTSSLLGKDDTKTRQTIKNLKTWLFVVSLLLLVSLILNLFQYLK